jgi:hypothetical protein
MIIIDLLPNRILSSLDMEIENVNGASSGERGRH